MRVPLQSLTPGVKNTQEADLGPEVLGIGCYFQQRLRARLEKEPEQNLLVLPDQWDQRMRDAEDQMVVVHGQQFALPRRQPLLTGVGLAFWTVAIPAGVVGDGLVSAARTLIAVAAERCRPAAQDGIEHLQLGPRQALTMVAGDSGIGSADGVGDLKQRPSHGCCSPPAQQAFAV